MAHREVKSRSAPQRAGWGRQLSAALVVGGYALVGVTWVLVSDVALRVLLPGRDGQLVGSMKGIGFVVVTTIALWGILAARDYRLARAERERVAAVEATTAIFRSSPLAIVAVDREGLITAWSPAAERVLGWSEAEVVGRPATILRPDDPAWVSRGFAEVMAGEVLVAVPVQYPHRDGRARAMELFAAPLRDDAGMVRGAVVVAEDVTAVHDAQADRARLATAIDQAAEAIVVTDPQGRIVYANPAFERVTGYARAELLGQNPRVLKSGAHDAVFYERLWATLLGGRTWRGTLTNRRKDGTLFEEEATISPVRDGAGVTTAYVGVKRDLSAERALEGELHAEIVDRLAVRAAIGQIVAGRTPEATASSIVEALLQVDGLEYPSVFHISTRPRRVVRLAGRVPGVTIVPGEEVSDERAAYLRERAADGPWLHVFAQEPPPGANAATIVSAGGITGGIYAPVLHEGRVVAVVGGVTTRSDPAATLGLRLGALLEVAAFAAPFLAPQLAAREDLEGARAAIRAITEDRRFHPVFQPIVRLADRSVIGYEALTRFDDEVTPDIRFAEAAALGCGVDLETACLQAAVAAEGELPAGTWLSVNASADMVLSGRMQEILGRVDRPVVVELMEHLAVDDYESLRAAVESLGPGVWLAVDDAGAGFAGLRHVAELRPHVVKLDVSIVRGVDGDPARQSLVAGMVHVARTSESHLVAEGVETEAEAEALGRLGVELAQGFLFARPAPIEEIVGERRAA
jgi:PAS domain S-box-containing protein